jgi:hypothetical protein
MLIQFVQRQLLQNTLYYNLTTKEVSYGPAAFVSGGTMNGALVIGSTTNATSTSTGALQVNTGGLGVGQNIYAGGNLNIAGVSTLTGNTLVSGSLGVNTNFVVTGTTTLTGLLSAGTGVFSGITTVTNVSQASSTSTGALQVRGGAAVGGDMWLGGNLILGGATAGISFAANANTSTMTGELLSDYEEGTWTPTVRTDTTQPSAVGYTGQLGIYTKVGNRVCVEAYLGWSSVTGGTGSIVIGGLPFNPSGYGINDSRGFNYLAGYGGPTFTGQLMSIVQDSSPNVLVYYNNNGTVASLALSNATAGTFRMIFSYQTA